MPSLVGSEMCIRDSTGALRAQLLRAQLFTGLRVHLTGASPNVKYTVLFLQALTGAVLRWFFTGALYGLTDAPYGRLRAQKCTLRALTGAYGRTFLCVLYGRTLRAYGRTLRALTGAKVYFTGAYGRLRALTGANFLRAYGRAYEAIFLDYAAAKAQQQGPNCVLTKTGLWTGTHNTTLCQYESSNRDVPR